MLHASIMPILCTLLLLVVLLLQYTSLLLLLLLNPAVPGSHRSSPSHLCFCQLLHGQECEAHSDDLR
jgi:hypothetical protein